MAHLDSAHDLQSSAARWTRIAFDHVAKIDRHRGLHVTVPANAREVRILFIGPAHEVRERKGAVVDIRVRYSEPNRSDEARLGAGDAEYSLSARHPQRAGHAGELLRLDGVQLVIAPDDECDDSITVCIHKERLDAARSVDAQESGQFLDRANPRSRDLLQLPGSGGTRLRRRQRRSGFQVGGVIVLIRERDSVFAG